MTSRIHERPKPAEVRREGGVGSPSDFVRYTFTSTAASTNTLLAFSGRRTVGSELLLDDVSVTASGVPEPSSLLLLGTGVLGLFGRFAGNCRRTGNHSDSH